MRCTFKPAQVGTNLPDNRGSGDYINLRLKLLYYLEFDKGSEKGIEKGLRSSLRATYQARF